VQGTPAVFVNGQLVAGAVPYARFEKIIKDKLAQA
jgi:protein-disulfide isomerase